MKLKTIGLVALLLAGALASCSKDKVTIPEPVPLTKWEKLAGDYKVFDSTGVFLYEMKIVHISGTSSGLGMDSLRFENLDGQYTFTEAQSSGNVNGWPDTWFFLGTHNPISDSLNNRWNLVGMTDYNYNMLLGNTIRLRFWRNNILYYLQDLTSYADETVVQFAVKQ